MAKSFILSDESVNDRGFRVLTDGINLERFEKNPIMLWMHKRDEGLTFTQVLPIGRWENIRKEDGKLMADPVFDENDKFAQLIKSKVDNGLIRGCSAGINPIEFSGAPELLAEGQKRETITKCELYEASIVDLPSNKNTVSLFSTGSETEVPLLNFNTMAEKDNKNLAFSSEEDLLNYMKEKFGFEPKAEQKEEKEFKFASEEDARNWFQKLFGIQPKTKTESEQSPETTPNPEVEQLKSEMQQRDAELTELKAQLENLKNAPAAELKDTAEATDDAPVETGEFLSSRDIELYNLIKQ